GAAERALVVERSLGGADAGPVQARRSRDEAKLRVQGAHADGAAQVRRRAVKALDDAGCGAGEETALGILPVRPAVEADVDRLAGDRRAIHPGRAGKDTTADRQAGHADVLNGIRMERQREAGVPVAAQVQAAAGLGDAAESRVARLGAFGRVGAEAEEAKER